MKRSESVLVYGVTGVLAVILAIAIIFGGETPQQDPNADKLAIGNSASEDDDIPFLDENALTDADREFQLLMDDDEITEPGDLASSDAGGDDSIDEPATNLAPVVPLHRTVQLGPSRIEENPASGARWRFVRVQPGDSIGLMIQRWCPGTELEFVAAMNEDLDLKRLRPNVEVCFPWVDDDILVEAQKRREATPVPATVERTTPSAVPAVATGKTYTLKEGDSLWLVAKREVGANKADAYVRAILASNPSIADAASVRAGQKITLPN